MRRLKWVVAVAVAGVALAGCLGPGMYQVTATLRNGTAAPGLWHSAGGGNCRWFRLDASGRYPLAVGFTHGGPQYVEVKAGDAYFQTMDCGLWVQADGPFDFKQKITSSGQFADGMYRVGIEVPPGRYLATQPRSCYWARLSDFSGNPGYVIPYGGSIIDNGRSGAVTIQPGDVGFDSVDCGIWTKVG